MNPIACLVFLFMAFANSHGEEENDKCLLISIVTETKEFDITWENEDAMKLIKQFKDYDQGNDAHQDIGEFSMMKHGGNWTFHVELISKFRIDVNVSVEFPAEVALTPSFIWVEAKSMDSRFISAHSYDIHPLSDDRRHWARDIYARMNLKELVAQGDSFKLSLIVGMDYLDLNSTHTTRQLCQDPKSVVQSAQSTDAEVKIESSDALSRVAIAWKINGAGNFYHQATSANTFVNFASVAVYSDVLYGGVRTFAAYLWNFGTFKTIEIKVKDNNLQSGIEQSQMNVTIVPEDHETLLTDMSRYLIQTKRAELYVNETDLSALKDSFTIVLTFDPTPGQYSV